MNPYEHLPDSDPLRDERFDACMRALHRDALAHVSPQLHWKLRPAAPTPTGGVAGRFGDVPLRSWRLGSAFAGVATAVFAVALGIGLWTRNEVQAPPPVAATATTDGDAAAALEQDPDFYAWLASDDAELVAME